MTAAARGRRRLHRRRADTVLAPGAVEIDDGLISWVGDPWQVPPAPGTEVRRLGGLLMPGLVNCHGHSPMTLLRSAGDGLPLERWLQRVRLAARGPAGGRGRVLGHAARGGRAALQRRHHDVRAVPAPDRRGRGRARGRHPHPLHAGHLRRARRRPGQHLGGAVGRRLRGGRRHGGDEHERLQMGFGPHAAYTVPPEGLRAIAAEARARGRACCRSTSPRRRPSARSCRSATA